MTLTDRNHTTPLKFKLIRAAFQVGGVIAPGLAARYAMNIFRTPRKRSETNGDLFDRAAIGSVPYVDFNLTTYTWEPSTPTEQTVLLVHGWESSAARVSVLVEPLLNAGYRVVAFDGPAHGRSEGQYADPLEFSDAVIAVLGQIGTVRGVIAHSLGAGGTMAAVGRYPDLPIERVVIIGAPDILRRYPELFATTVGLPDSVYNGMKSLYEDRLGMALTDTDVSKLVKQIRQPGLVIHDQKDRIVPFSDAENIVANWDGAESLFTSGYGHRRILSQPEVAKRIVAFLGE
jgi:pimeloyl-ACP methyl ester carboxylesterase